MVKLIKINNLIKILIENNHFKMKKNNLIKFMKP